MDQVGNCWEFTGNPRSPLGVLGVHWESTGNRGRVETTALFWFGIIHNKDKHWEGLNRESLGKMKLNVPFVWDVNLSTIVSVSCSDFNDENENYTLITMAVCFQTPRMTVYYHKKSESKNTPWKDLVLAEIWLLTMADSEHTNFICGWLIHAICILTFQIPSPMPNEDMPKKAPQK